MGDHDMVCSKADKLARHNYVCGALIRLADLVDLPARRATVVDMRANRADCRLINDIKLIIVRP
eukprot:SAG31_NODE_12788_length_917_cov_0.788509_3_plen_64_part_01